MKLKQLIIVGVVLSAGLLVNVNLAKADGGILYPPNYYAAETTQKALIYFAN